MHRHYESETLASRSQVAVYQCGHGLLHLRVNGVTLTFKPDKFRQLAMLVSEALIRRGGCVVTLKSGLGGAPRRSGRRYRTSCV